MTNARELRWSVPFNMIERGHEKNEKTRAIAKGCILAQMSAIPNELAAVEYLFRAYALTLAGAQDFLGISYSDIEENIGLRTNVIKAPRPMFLAALARHIAATATERTATLTALPTLELQNLGWDGTVLFEEGEV